MTKKSRGSTGEVERGGKGGGDGRRKGGRGDRLVQPRMLGHCPFLRETRMETPVSTKGLAGFQTPCLGLTSRRTSSSPKESNCMHRVLPKTGFTL